MPVMIMIILVVGVSLCKENNTDSSVRYSNGFFCIGNSNINIYDPQNSSIEIQIIWSKKPTKSPKYNAQSHSLPIQSYPFVYLTVYSGWVILFSTFCCGVLLFEGEEDSGKRWNWGKSQILRITNGYYFTWDRYN